MYYYDIGLYKSKLAFASASLVHLKIGIHKAKKLIVCLSAPFALLLKSGSAITLVHV